MSTSIPPLADQIVKEILDDKLIMSFITAAYQKNPDGNYVKEGIKNCMAACWDFVDKLDKNKELDSIAKETIFNSIHASVAIEKTN